MICDSYIDLSLISGPPGKGIMVCVCVVFSLEMLFKRENKACQKGGGCVEGCKYSRHSYLVFTHHHKITGLFQSFCLFYLLGLSSN